ncbi:MAG: hypothetical protein AAFN30_18400 [Actinomycetota bacterium]
MSDQLIVERGGLEKKDKGELQAIVSALGGKAASRAKKADLIDQILELSGATLPGDGDPAGAEDTGERDTPTDAADTDADADTDASGNDGAVNADDGSDAGTDDGATGAQAADDVDDNATATTARSGTSNETTSSSESSKGGRGRGGRYEHSTPCWT